MTGQSLKKLSLRNAPVLKPLTLASALVLSVAAGCGGAPENEQIPDAVGSVSDAATTNVYYNGGVYALVTDALSWPDARAACAAKGAGWALATIDNVTEEAFLARYQGSSIWWLGGSQRTDGTWGWERSQDTEGVATRAYFNWGTSQPDNTGPTGGDANCVADDATSGRWGDYACPTAYAYICEKRYEGDFDGDAQADLIMRAAQGDNALWYMNGTTLKGSSFITGVYDGGTDIVGSADFNRDQHNDLLFRSNVSGKNVIWFMNLGRMVGIYELPDEADINWKIVGLGDFDHNDSMDILWRHATTGDNRIWYMYRWEYVSTGIINPDSNLASEIVGSGDFNNDGRADILWRRATDGAMRVWFMNGANYVSSATLPTESNLDWKVGGVGSYAGTSPNDIVWYNSATNDVRIWRMRDTSLVSSHFVNKAQNGWWKAMGSR